MSALILRNEVVHYEVLGRGRPLVFLHGWVGSWRYWISAMQAVSMSFRTYALDLWGYGDTAKAVYYYPLEDQIALVEQFLQGMGIGKIALIGHGLGSVVSLLYAFQHPDQVDRQMLVSLPFQTQNLNPRLQTAPIPDLADWLIGRNPAVESIRLEAPKADKNALLVSLSNLRDLDLPQMLQKLKFPTLLVNGSNDPLNTRPSVEQLGELPDFTHHLSLDDCGHFPMLDEPVRFNRLLVDFLSQEAGESPRQLQLKEEWKRRVR